MARDLTELKWIEELLPMDEINRKSMFGGFAYYFGGKIALVVFESEGDYVYKNKCFKFEIWNGCMFPVEREFHPQIRKAYPYLLNHPVLPKWFYLPAKSENFEEQVADIIKKVFRPNSNWGSIPEAKKPKQVVAVKYDPSLDMRTPKMFADELPQKRLEVAKRISDLKNIGPVTEEAMNKAGIKSVQQFVKLGWRNAMKLLVAYDKKNLHTLFAYAIFGALNNQEWNGLSSPAKAEIKVFMQSLRDQAKIQKLKPASKKTKKQKRF